MPEAVTTFIVERCDDELDLQYDAGSGEKTATVLYLVTGTEDGTLGAPVSCEPEDAWAWALENLPQELVGMALVRVVHKEVVNEAQHLMQAEYKFGQSEEDGKKTEDGVLINPFITVETTGKTERVYYSLATKSTKVPSDGPIIPNIIEFDGGINVGESGPEGVDIPAKNFTWTEKWYFQKNTVSWAYLASLGNLTGTINDDTFRGFAPECVMFLGISFSPETNSNYHVVTFSFQYNKGGTDYWVEKFEEFQKSGWDYIWLYSVETVDANGNKVRKPVQLNQEQVCWHKDFPTVLKIGQNLPATANIPLTGSPVIAT